MLPQNFTMLSARCQTQLSGRVLPLDTRRLMQTELPSVKNIHYAHQ